MCRTGVTARRRRQEGVEKLKRLAFTKPTDPLTDVDLTDKAAWKEGRSWRIRQTHRGYLREKPCEAVVPLVGTMRVCNGGTARGHEEFQIDFGQSRLSRFAQDYQGRSF